MWEKIVLNLLSNAFKFTFDGGDQRGAAARRTASRPAVGDTGIGIPAGELPRLSSASTASRARAARTHEGTGIGLALVQELVSLHGGTITVESTVGEAPRSPSRSRSATTICRPSMWPPAAGPRRPSAAATRSSRRRCAGCRAASAPAAALPPAAAAAPGRPPRAPRRGCCSPTTTPTCATTCTACCGARLRGDGGGRRPAALDAVRAQPPDLVLTDVMMPGLDGFGLLAALRADPRPRRAGDDAVGARRRGGAHRRAGGRRRRLPGQAVLRRELLARVRANLELARLRNHHARWRAALIDSLHEAFFLCDETGAVVEINAAFTGILGYGPEGLPYVPEHVWWPPEDAEPEAHRQVSEAFRQLMEQSKGSFVAPVTHKDGHRLWVAASFNEVQDPDTGRRMVVGTFRDITAEHYAGQREAALAAMGLLLSQASSVPQALQGAINELQRLWRARRVLAVTWNGGAEPSLMSTGTAIGWPDLPAPLRDTIAALRRQALLSPTQGGSGPAGRCRATGRLGYGGRNHGPAPARPAGRLDRRGRRPALQRRGPRPLLALLCGYLGQALSRVYQTNQQRETALALQRAIPRARPAFHRFRGALRAGQPAARGGRRLVRTSSSCPTGGSVSWSGIASGTGWTPRP